MKKVFVFLAFIFLTISMSSLMAQSPVGVWKTIDDETGNAKSYVEIYENGGKLYGKVTKLISKPADSICDKCKGDKKNQPIVGMNIIDNMTLQDGYYQGGTILDPAKGDYYRCSFWLEGGNANILNVKGKHWSGLSRTQKWYRVQ